MAKEQKKFDNKDPFELFEETLKYVTNIWDNILYDVDYLNN